MMEATWQDLAEFGVGIEMVFHPRVGVARVVPSNLPYLGWSVLVANCNFYALAVFTGCVRVHLVLDENWSKDTQHEPL